LPYEPRPTQAAFNEPPADCEPPTLNGPLLGGSAERDPAEEWALIRYVGHPIGEVISVGESGLSLGRAADNQVRLAEPEVSRYHARLELVTRKGLPATVLLSDLASTNGTFVNGVPIHPSGGPTMLRSGDVIRVGTHAFKLKHLDELERGYHQAVLAQATVDPLTHVSNRGAVLAFLEKHTDLARRYQRPLSLIICDLDHFKEVNDQFGHAAGDVVLERFASIVSGRLRACDQVGRIGGEEFLVVLPETGGQDALAAAEGLRSALAEEPIAGPSGEVLRVTCCFGVTSYSAPDLDSGTFLARADAALYRAKAGGRNRVEFDGQL
jgi:diguanylate cyclase (GGDEF)-like protein